MEQLNSSVISVHREQFCGQCTYVTILWSLYTCDSSVVSVHMEQLNSSVVSVHMEQFCDHCTHGTVLWSLYTWNS